MTSTETANRASKPPEDGDDEVLVGMHKRTLKLAVTVTGFLAPVELAVALTHHSANSLMQNLLLLVVVLLVFSFQRHTADLSDQLDDDERFFRLLTSPPGRIVYFLFAAAALVILGLNIFQFGL